MKVSLSEICSYFGEDIAKECEQMEVDEVREFPTVTYMAIIVRCIKWRSVYDVTGENILEEALEEGEEMGMDF